MVVEREIAQLPIYDRYIVKLKSNDFMLFSAQTPIESINANIQSAHPTANAQVWAVIGEKQVRKLHFSTFG